MLDILPCAELQDSYKVVWGYRAITQKNPLLSTLKELVNFGQQSHMSKELMEAGDIPH